MKTEDRQPAWERLVNKALADYSSLAPAKRIWFNAETMEDLVTIEAHDVVRLLARVNKFLPGGTPSVDIDERNDVIAS